MMIGKHQLKLPETGGSARSIKPVPVKSEVARVQSSATMLPASDVEMALWITAPRPVC
jgi:hypothetical protein